MTAIPFSWVRAPRRNLSPSRRPFLEQLEDRCVLSTLTIDGSQRLQTIAGFGTNLSSEAWNGGAVTPSLDILLSHGYKLFRVIVEPVQGWEDTNPNTGQYSASNPNWAYYNNLYSTSTKFTNLWNTISYLNNHGATVWVNLQSDAPAWMTDNGAVAGTIGQDHEADWATMVSTMMNYAVNTAHVRIDSLGPMNEPDLPAPVIQGPQVDATQYVRMLDILETQLQGYGLGNIPLVGPDVAFVSDGVNSYVPAMLADSFLMPHVMQFGFHTYQTSVTDTAITNNSTYPGRQLFSTEYDGNYYNEDLGQRATPAQLWTQADQSFQNLMQIIGAGENGAVIWDGVDNFYEYFQQWSAHGLISYDWTAPNPTAQSDYGTTPRLYANAQVFQFVATGSVVIGSSTNASNFLAEAFLNPNGQITIAGENTGTSAQTITGNLTGGLNASLLNLYFTNSSLNEQQQANVVVTNNTFTFTVPADTIFTLTSTAVPSVTGVTPISGLTAGGQSVTITGSGFSGATAVAFGGIAAKSFTINSDSSITAVTPAEGVGVVDVTVATPGGSSPVTSADHFQYVAVNGTAPPTVANPASAILASNQASAALSVLGASQYAANTLTYNWQTTGTPPGPVSFSTNGNNSAANVTVSFAKVGTYSLQATITDPAGNMVTSSVTITVNQVATTLTVSPSQSVVAPNGTYQFSSTATNQFSNPYTATPVAWTVSGGGTIDNTGKFTAGNVIGGPFTVTASVGGLSATASVSISNNVNLALNGTASSWFGMSSATSNTNQIAAPGLNDNNLTTDVPLDGGGDDIANAFEAGGVTWSTLQTLSKVVFINGSFDASTYDGVFDNNFGLQTTTNGSTWTNVTGWSVTPSYQYNLAAAAGVTYTFTGPALSVLGVRVVGQVHSLTGNDSWMDNATEVQAFGSSPVSTTVNLTANGISAATAGGSLEVGDAATFTVSVAASSGTASGTVQLKDAANNNVLVGSAQTLSGGSVTFTVTATAGNNLGVGTHKLIAVYTPTGNFAASQSGQVGQVIDSVFKVQTIGTTATSNLVQTATGFVATFNAPVKESTLNLYGAGVASLTFVTGTTPVNGTLVFDATATRATFVATGSFPAASTPLAGLLTAGGTYTVDLSGTNASAFQDVNGHVLGSNSATGGIDFIASFTSTNSATAVTVSVPYFARGYSQTVNVVANSTNGVPISINVPAGGTPVTSATFDLFYDPTLLTVTGGTIAAGFTGTATVIAPGQVHVTISGTLAAGTIKDVVYLTASVPSTAPYRNKEVLDIRNISINGGTNNGQDGSAVHAAVFLGDTQGPSIPVSYSAQDAFNALKASTGLAGAIYSKLLDPTILTDDAGVGRPTSQDAFDLIKKTVGLSVPQIPDLPTGGAQPPVGGPDPYLYLDPATSAAVGSTVTVHVNLKSLQAGGFTLDSSDIAMSFDPTKIQITNVRAGSYAAVAGFSSSVVLVANPNNQTGTLFVSEFLTNGSGIVIPDGTSGDIIDFDVTVLSGITGGSTVIKLNANIGSHYTQVNGGQATLTPAPNNKPYQAATDDLFTIVSSVAPVPSPRHRIPTARTKHLESPPIVEATKSASFTPRLAIVVSQLVGHPASSEASNVAHGSLLQDGQHSTNGGVDGSHAVVPLGTNSPDVHRRAVTRDGRDLFWTIFGQQDLQRDSLARLRVR